MLGARHGVNEVLHFTTGNISLNSLKIYIYSFFFISPNHVLKTMEMSRMITKMGVQMALSSNFLTLTTSEVD